MGWVFGIFGLSGVYIAGACIAVIMLLLISTQMKAR